MGSSSSSNANQDTENSQMSTVDNSVDNSSSWEDNSQTQTIDNSTSSADYTDNSSFSSSNDYTDNSSFSSSNDYTDNSSFSSSNDYTDNRVDSSRTDSSYKDSSVYSSSADYTDNSSFSDNHSYTDNSTHTTSDFGAISAGRDVSISALSAVSNSNAQLNQTFREFSLRSEAMADSALQVASNVANNNAGNFSAVGVPLDVNNVFKMTLLAVGVMYAMKRAG